MAAPAVDKLPVVQAAELAHAEVRTAWLVESMWLDQGVGVLGGAPKCCKSWLALQMATAVASGKPCLARYAVPRPGRTLVYMAEDSQGRRANLASVGQVTTHRLRALPVSWFRRSIPVRRQ